MKAMNITKQLLVLGVFLFISSVAIAQRTPSAPSSLNEIGAAREARKAYIRKHIMKSEVQPETKTETPNKKKNKKTIEAAKQIADKNNPHDEDYKKMQKMVTEYKKTHMRK